MFSSDDKIFDHKHDSYIRMKEYSQLVNSIDVLIFCDQNKIYSDGKLTIYPLNAYCKFFKPFYYIKASLRLAKYKKIGSVVTQDPLFYGLCGYLIARMLKAKLIVSVYGTNIFNVHWLKESFSNRLRFYLGQFILSRANVIQADGFEDIKELKYRYGNKVFWKPIIPSNIEEFIRIKRNPHRDIFEILFVGRLVKQKNIPFLVEIIKGVTARSIDKKIHFTIIGDGPLRHYLLDQINRNHLGDFIDYRQECSRQEMVQIYAKSQLLILSSLYEGFAKVFMEAAAAGLPIVSTRVSGVSNIIINKENSFVLEQGDLEGYLERIFELIEQPSLWDKFSNNIRKDFVLKYRASMTINIQKEIFEYIHKKRLLIITQIIDVNHGVLGFFHHWVEEFSKECSVVTLICLQKGEHSYFKNVKILSLGKDNCRKCNRIGYLFRFYLYIWRERNNYDAVFVHMNQLYVILGGLLWRILGKKIGLWYTHGSIPYSLWLAEVFTNIIFTASPESFRLNSNKILVTGHGIDTEIFIPDPNLKSHDKVMGLLTIGRISPVKDYETLLRSLSSLSVRGINFNLKIIGGPGNEEQKRYLIYLKELIKELNLSEHVELLGSLPQSQIVKYLQADEIFVSMSNTGSLDKAVLEAMACGLPVITCNEAFVSILRSFQRYLIFEKKNSEQLADKIESLYMMTNEDKAILCAELRNIVVCHHNLSSLIKNIILSYESK